MLLFIHEAIHSLIAHCSISVREPLPSLKAYASRGSPEEDAIPPIERLRRKALTAKRSKCDNGTKRTGRGRAMWNYARSRLRGIIDGSWALAGHEQDYLGQVSEN